MQDKFWSFSDLLTHYNFNFSVYRVYFDALHLYDFPIDLNSAFTDHHFASSPASNAAIGHELL